ncbi:MAG TPA: phosphate ABC transporter ATP-binding protein PstB [Candidatus Limnocylindria bacterium]|nr:phosphate ABC transporter ATP-binding protein PstB [Candidatus Limnocylindria bacterium]
MTEALPLRPPAPDERPERATIRVIPFDPPPTGGDPTRTAGTDPATKPVTETALELQDVSCWYGGFRAVRDVSLTVARGSVTALIGPSGCGKSTLLRTMNRMNDLVPSFRLDGAIRLDGQDLYGRGVDPVAVRRRIGMVFQKPNPFPKSIFDNVAFGAKINGFQGDMKELVEQSLRRAALWDEVKDKLGQSALALSGGQQQRLCIARAIATEPEIILMDEPCSALDPRATLQIEELMRELSARYTIVIVTHNMQQAARASDVTAFMTMGEDRAGYLVEMDETIRIFTNPREGLTEDYISGRFG